MTAISDNAYSEIKKLKNEHETIHDYYIRVGNVSLALSVDSVFKKILLLSAASHCESRITDVIINLYDNNCTGKSSLSEFVKKQALERKFHTLFNWGSNNTNRFYGLFGNDFKCHMEIVKNIDDELAKQEKAFLDLGSLRNHAVHENLVNFHTDKTTSEIFEDYERACKFIDRFALEIQNYLKPSGK